MQRGQTEADKNRQHQEHKRTCIEDELEKKQDYLDEEIRAKSEKYVVILTLETANRTGENIDELP